MGKKRIRGESEQGKAVPSKDENNKESKKKKQKLNAPKQTPSPAAKGNDAPATWSKSKKKRMRMLKIKLGKEQSKTTSPGKRQNTPTAAEDVTVPMAKTEGKKATTSKLQNDFKARLTGSRFRILNEELYTTTSAESYDRFSKNPELFEQYHEGFRYQVESWPVNPVDVIVKWCSNQYQQAPCVVADFGCGDAQLAKDLLRIKRKGEPVFTVHSFDLISPNELVTACDMAHVPLKNKSVDVCVFCLSLMGTNLADFIREAHRVLKDSGKVKIAEVRSRIEYSHSNAPPAKQQQQQQHSKSPNKDAPKNAGTLSEFVDVLKELGFKCTKTDRSNKMFLLLELEKNGKAPNKSLAFSAKPCIYKRR